MTFHVLYNDCHLEADMERERESGEGTKRRGRRGVGGHSEGRNGLGHL